jgi:[glutamine synthetase] adenylyltransferase / [glutamine synthetase]-adenylyl-L-tyrosine phosphorylase
MDKSTRPFDRGHLLANAKIFINPTDHETAKERIDSVIAVDQVGRVKELLETDQNAAALLFGALGSSPYLTRLSELRPETLINIVHSSPSIFIDELVERIRSAQFNTEEELMRSLRVFKQRAALALGLADLCKAMSTQETTSALTFVADACICAAVNFVLQDCSRDHILDLEDFYTPNLHSGWIILAMGKQGAFELNYSSDVDLISLFDRSRIRLRRTDDDASIFSSMTRRVIRILGEVTGDGYVFRPDLRLRPNPGANSLALPVISALTHYYQSGQTWERAALIKARPVAGDLEAGELFLSELSSFVWGRRPLAPAQELERILDRYRQHQDPSQFEILGRDIKLGRGGIREIEFFTQSRQLLDGGHLSQLRCRATLEALDKMASHEIVSPHVTAELSEAYLFLRDVEHRIQIVNDEQCHKLPENEFGVKNIAHMMGFATHEDFVSALLGRMSVVRNHWLALALNQ